MRPLARPAVGLLAPIVLAATEAVAQDIEPRTYTNIPVGANALVVGGGPTTGEVVFDGTRPVEDAA